MFLGRRQRGKLMMGNMGSLEQIYPKIAMGSVHDPYRGFFRGAA